MANLPPINDPMPAAPVYNAGDRSAIAILRQSLEDYGLGTLGLFAWNEYLADIPIEQIMLDIREHPDYKARFPAMKELAKKGQAISEQNYIDYENTVKQVFHNAGLPSSFYDQPDDFTNFLLGSVSPKEIQDRVDIAKSAVYNSDPTTLQALESFYGVGGSDLIGDATAYFLDPERALPAIQKQFIAAQTEGAATRTGWGSVGRTEAEHLATLGISPDQALQGFGTLSSIGQLFTNLPGEAPGAPTREQGQQAVFEGNAAANTAVENQRSRRKAQFGGGGGYTSTQKGIGGVG
jgi:hypothetical protein